MTKSLSLSVLFAFFSIASLSQENFEKECRIAGGVGFAGATKNTKTVGCDIWLQLGYRLTKNVSIATEFENMSYTQPGYYNDLPVNPNEVMVIDNNFSLLLKYHLPTRSKLKVAFASGWTYMTRQSDYYIYENDGTTGHWFPDVTSFNDYRIPLLVELEYPLLKKLNVQARGKYNLNPQNGDTYSGGIGLSLSL